MAETITSGFLKLAKKALTVITTSVGLLMQDQERASAQSNVADLDADRSISENSYKKRLKPKLILKMNSGDPEDYLLAQHRSHSSHSSHRSHSSHYSSSGGRGGGGVPLGLLVVGGVIAYGAYQAGKSDNVKKR
jgi:hypothetical protein